MSNIRNNRDRSLVISLQSHCSRCIPFSSFADSGMTEQADPGTTAEATYGEGAGPGSPQSPGKTSAPPGTPDGSDDDVVARQLREAAEKETDPELKKKLWEEYRKYKDGTF